MMGPSSLEWRPNDSQVRSSRKTMNSLPNDKILDLAKLKEFAGNKINVTQKLKFVLRRVENIVRK